MNRRNVSWIAALTLSSLLFASLADAQAARRPVRARGNVTGVELSLVGSLSAPRGGFLRWSMTAYDVVGLSELRPSSGAQVRVDTSLDTDSSAVDVEADARGRVVVEIPIPEDADGVQMGTVITVRSRAGASRRFELAVALQQARQLELEIAPPSITPGERVHAFGRLRATATGRGIAGAPLTIQFLDGDGPVGAPLSVTTDGAGAYHVEWAVPLDARGNIRAQVEHQQDEDNKIRTEGGISIVDPVAPDMVVLVRPAFEIVEPNALVDVEVVVRRGDGRPVQNAMIPWREGRHNREIYTDAQGRARLRYLAPRLQRGVRDVNIQVTAERAGIGRASGSAQLRVAASDHLTGLAVDGGALSLELGGTVYVRVLERNGLPATNTTAVIEGPRIARQEARTDADGVAAFEVSLARTPTGEDSCGGDVATAIVVTVGTGPRGANNTHCVSVDPELNTRIAVGERAPQAGQHVAVTVSRGRAVRGRPIAVTMLQRHSGQMRVVASQVVGPRETVAELPIPSDVVGALTVRARPIYQNGQELRGSVTSLYAMPGPTLSVSTSLNAQGAHQANVTGDAQSLLAIAMSAADARSFADAEIASAPFGLRVPVERAGELLLAAGLSAHTPRDLHASAVIRDGQRVAVPAPAQPTQVGLLRDPWRAQARFVEGRMGLLFRAVENRVKRALPNRIEDVAFERRGRLRFNRQILAGIPEGELGGEGATSLGGEPLSVEELERLDPAFTYDNTARRITRERLFSLLLALRNFVQSQALDLPWARPGEPALWLEKLIGRHVPGANVSIAAGDLVDAWGRPFRLIETRSPRFAALAPVAGYELVSAGPDGRYGNRDDLFDPTARVLPNGSLYANAVGEDSLVARLRGVELGRVTIAFAGQTFSIGTPGIVAPAENQVSTSAVAAWQQLPAIFRPVRASFSRVTKRPIAQSGRTERASLQTQFAFDVEPRDWGVLTRAYSVTGATAQATDRARGGVPILVDAIVPDRLTLGRPLQTFLHVTSLAEPGSGDVRFGLSAESELASIEHPSEITLPAGQTFAVPLTLRGNETGRAELAFRLDGDPPLTTSASVSIDRAHHPIRRRAVELVESGSRDFAITVPSDAVDPTTRVVLIAPSFLAADPDLADVRRVQPGLVAWSYARAGLTIDPALRSGLLRALNAGQTFSTLSTTDMPLLRAACRAQAFAWIADDESTNAQRRATSELRRPSSLEDLAAAALVMRPMEEPERFHDMSLGSSRVALRRVLRDFPEEPSLMARASAALLWADPRDGHGRAMLERASAAREQHGAGAIVIPSEERDAPLERFVATAALAIAAELADQPELAESLAKGAMSIAPIAARAGGESTFWMLALGAHGVLGNGASSVRVTVDGETQEVDLSNGAASIPINGRGRHAVRVTTDGSVVARVESVFAREMQARSEGPFEMEVLGDPGRYRGPSGLVLRVKSGDRVRDGVIDLVIPAGAMIDERAERLFTQNASVRSVERRAPGFIRLRLVEMLDGQQHDIALPFHWHAFGDADGLSAIGYGASEPAAMTVVTGAEITIAAELE